MIVEKLEKLHESMATKDCIKQWSEKIIEQRQRIEHLEEKVPVMEKYVGKLEQRLDDKEQYNRRLCLRIDGIPTAEEGKTESGEQCLGKVKQIFKNLNVSIPDTAIDRTHWNRSRY